MICATVFVYGCEHCGQVRIFCLSVNILVWCEHFSDALTPPTGERNALGYLNVLHSKV